MRTVDVPCSHIHTSLCAMHPQAISGLYAGMCQGLPLPLAPMKAGTK